MGLRYYKSEGFTSSETPTFDFLKLKCSDMPDMVQKSYILLRS